MANECQNLLPIKMKQYTVVSKKCYLLPHFNVLEKNVQSFQFI